QAATQRGAVLRDTVAESEVEAAAAALGDADQRLQQVRAASAEASEATAEARRREAESRGRLREEEAAQSKLEAEIAALTALLEPAEADMWPPVVDAVTVAPGYEAALGAALGDDLTVSADEAAPVHWQTLGPLAAVAALPAGAEPLNAVVKGPA